MAKPKTKKGKSDMPPQDVLDRLKHIYTASNGRKFIIIYYRDKWRLCWQNAAFPKWYWDQTQGSEISYCPYIGVTTENRNPYLLCALCQ